LPLAYHGDVHQSLCHVCGYKESIRTSCPTCGNTEIVFRSAGTKAIVDEVSRLFPEARVQRFDTDNSKSERLEQHFESIKAGDVDILVGTQLLAKGLDLPRLSTLGIVLADSSLAIPDYTSQERTYQLILQVLGRIGRGHTNHATAVLQTYTPDHPAIVAALSEDWESFYERELLERKTYNFPPYCHLLKISCRRASSSAAERAAKKLLGELRSNFGNVVHIDGPAPAFHEKRGNQYEWQLVLKSSNRQHLVDIIATLPDGNTSYDLDPFNLL
jgi:primosomal protein N' (replication factor Y)